MERDQQKTVSTSLSPEPEAQEITLDDLNCSICNKFMTEPAITTCGHIFCLHCIIKYKQTNSCCSLCGEAFKDNYTPQVDLKLQEVIQKQFPKEFNARKKE